MAETKWWEGRPAKEVALIGLLTRELCLPIDELYKALHDALGRGVYTHEIALNLDALIQELHGERDAPTLEDIINLIPAEKRILIQP